MVILVITSSPMTLPFLADQGDEEKRVHRQRSAEQTTLEMIDTTWISLVKYHL